ncbi:LigB family dioxygenase [compost metagenome]
MSLMPVLFIGHGSPMNALAHNAFTESLARLGQELPRPRAILCVSAHWETQGTQVLYAQEPITIHDFYGFPEQLFKMEYPAHGDLQMAHETQELIPNAQLSDKWGLDHGTWSVLVHMYPHADIPVYQLSLDLTLPAEQHYEIGKQLQKLREEGVLILGSGNIVHNLRMLRRRTGGDEVYPWAHKFDDDIKQALLKRDDQGVIRYEELYPEESILAVPTPEHFVPLLYTLGASRPEDKVSFPFEGFEMGSLSMRSVMWS